MAGNALVVNAVRAQVVIAVTGHGALLIARQGNIAPGAPHVRAGLQQLPQPRPPPRQTHARPRHPALRAQPHTLADGARIMQPAIRDHLPDRITATALARIGHGIAPIVRQQLPQLQPRQPHCPTMRRQRP